MARLIGKLRDVGISVNLICSVLKVPLPLLRRSNLSAFGARVNCETLLKEIGIAGDGPEYMAYWTSSRGAPQST